MSASTACGPSLRITRHDAEDGTQSFDIEVWSPFTGSYQPVHSAEEGIRRFEEMADLIGQMRIRKHPKCEDLVDVPFAEGAAHGPFAEFRVTVAATRSYDTRQSGHPGWVRALGMVQAAQTTYAEVGFDPMSASDDPVQH